jgi:predicted CopG family antitoxin
MEKKAFLEIIIKYFARKKRKRKSVLMTLIQNEESLLVYVKEGYDFCAI